MAPGRADFVVAADSASDPAYSISPEGAWAGLNPTSGENPPGTDNGGFGFQPWDFAGGFHDPAVSPQGRLNHFVDGVDFLSSGFNDLGGPAFALTNSNRAFFGYTTRATRVLNRPLTPGASVTLDFDNPILDPLANNDTAGIIIRFNSGGGPRTAANPDVSERFGLFVQDNFRQGDWQVTDSRGTVRTDVPHTATTTGATLRFSLVDEEQYAFELLTLDGSAALYSGGGTLTGALGRSIDSIELVLFGAGGSATGERELFFDNLTVRSPFSGVEGDFNNDGRVDAADYTAWRDRQGDPAGALPNDFDSGPIGPAQYATWQAAYGANAGAQPAVVPEPAAACLALLAGGSVASVRNRLTPN